MKRRDFVRAGIAAGATALGAGACASPGATAAPGVVQAARSPGEPLKQSVCKWPFPRLSLEELAVAAKQIGLQSIELLGPADWPTVQKHGLTCAMGSNPAPHSIGNGFNRPANHDVHIAAYEQLIGQAASAGIPSVICFSGNRGGMSDAEGLENCATALRRLMPVAERHGVNVVMELLNSKVDHPDYMCDHSAWGVELVKRVGSDRFRLLYDIYHMQIMEGDVIRTIKTYHPFFAHYHTAGNPGRHELDENQELFYPAIMRAIKETGFRGYVGQEFVPTRDPVAALAEAVRICDV